MGRRLRRHRLVGRVVRLKVRFPPFVTRTRQAQLACPGSDDRAIFQKAVELFDRLVPDDRPVRLLGVGAADLLGEGTPVQPGLFDGARRARRVADAMDAIRDRFGDGAIHRGG